MKYLVTLIVVASWLFSAEIYIASGAGYKRPIMELAKIFEQEKNIKINPMFGNMQQINEQIKNTEKISVFFGDEDFIKKLKVPFDEKVELGDGKLVLVFSKNKENFDTIKDLKNPNVKKIGLPDTKKAIYGMAAGEFLKNTYQNESLKDKLMTFQTVPQVSSYLVNGDLDAGFINKTDYIGIANKVGNMVEIDQKLYNPIKIVGVVLKDKESKETKALFDFLQTPQAKNILKQYGL